MNYGRIRQRLKEKQKELQALKGKDRVRAEQMLIKEASEEKPDVRQEKKEDKKEDKEEKKEVSKKRGRPRGTKSRGKA